MVKGTAAVKGASPLQIDFVKGATITGGSDKVTFNVPRVPTQPEGFVSNTVI